jgi:hypothetical protein
MTRKALGLTAAVVAAVFLYLLATLPASPAGAVGADEKYNHLAARTIPGAFHVHSTRSDGSGDRAAIAAAAARAGLRFVVLTDHGDATRPPDPPEYLHGVLMLDGVEISTNGGHVIALDMPATPYPLGGEAAAVIEDILRFGGMPVAAHPDSPKPELAWKDWSLPVAGIEWLNLDSAWRDEPTTRLVRVGLAGLIRPAPAVASILARPTTLLEKFDRLASTRRIVALAGHDAHGGIVEGGRPSIWRSLVPRVTSYETSFATFSVKAILDAPLARDAARDARALLDAIRAGRLFTAIDAQAGPAYVDFRATVSGTSVAMGESVRFVEGTELAFFSTYIPESTAVLLRNGGEVARATGGEMRFKPTEPGAYRVEVRNSQAHVPWIVTNPIYLTASGGGEPVTSPVPDESSTVVVRRPSSGAQIERDPGSSAALKTDDGVLALDFSLREGTRVSQYVALSVPLSDQPVAFDRIAFIGHASSPMRVSVQLRFESAGGARWARSVYLAPGSHEVSIPVAELLPADNIATRPASNLATSLLFVVDLTNASPGQRGSFAVSDLQFRASK